MNLKCALKNSISYEFKNRIQKSDIFIGFSQDFRHNPPCNLISFFSTEEISRNCDLLCVIFFKLDTKPKIQKLFRFLIRNLLKTAFHSKRTFYAEHIIILFPFENENGFFIPTYQTKSWLKIKTNYHLLIYFQ